jgi:hypothetical protein
MSPYMTRILLVFLSILMLTVPAAQASSLSPSGVVEGVIIQTRSDVAGLFSIWLKDDDKMHEFMVKDARIVGGDQSTLVPGVTVRIQYSHLEPSEMDDFFTADAVTVTVLK